MTIHNENVRLVESIAQMYIQLWRLEGRPFEAPTELLKHAWTRIAGVIDRCNRIFSGGDVGTPELAGKK